MFYQNCSCFWVLHDTPKRRMIFSNLLIISSLSKYQLHMGCVPAEKHASFFPATFLDRCRLMMPTGADWWCMLVAGCAEI